MTTRRWRWARSAGRWARTQRAERLLALTGLTPDSLRERIDEPAFLAAVLRFLESHEPDLLACASDMGVDPAALVAARRRLEG